MKLKRQWMTAALAALIATGGAAIVQAQPDPNNGGNGPGPGQQGPDFRDMTPEQRQAAMEKRQDETLRANMANAGYTDKAVQDAVVDYVKTKNKAVPPLRDQARKLIEAIRDKDDTDAQLGTLLNDFRAAAETEKDRRKTAEAALDAKIGYKKSPRLEAYLTMLGIIGDEASLLTNNAGRPGGPGGGPGGPGGGPGGPGGGPGGPGGGPGGPGGGGPGGGPPGGNDMGGPPPGGGPGN